MSEEGPLRKFLHGEGPILSTLRGKERIYRERPLIPGAPDLDTIVKLYFTGLWAAMDVEKIEESWLWEHMSPEIRKKWEAAEDHFRKAAKELWDIGVASYGKDKWNEAIEH